MFHSILQSVFLAIIGIMVLGLIAPAFYTSEAKLNPLLERFVVPIYDGKDTTQAMTVGHLESLLAQQLIKPQNVYLVAVEKGLYLLEKSHKYEKRLQALLDKGMQAYACDTGLTTIRSRHAGQFHLMDKVAIVADGKQLIDTLMEKGFTNSFA